jgi:hypothetical protein
MKYGPIASLQIAAQLRNFFIYESLFEEKLLNSTCPTYAECGTRTRGCLPKCIEL